MKTFKTKSQDFGFEILIITESRGKAIEILKKTYYEKHRKEFPYDDEQFNAWEFDTIKEVEFKEYLIYENCGCDCVNIQTNSNIHIDGKQIQTRKGLC